jgi:DNA-binding response OmpR family regulator
MTRILIIEDEPALARALAITLHTSLIKSAVRDVLDR